MNRLFLSAAVLAMLFNGCGDDGGGSSSDSGPAGVDAGPAVVCSGDSDCDNGAFCDGSELCMPGGAGADAMGCVAGEAVTCEGDDVCDEIEDLCRPDCGENADMDGDGFDSMMCGGDDCDDTNPDRWPGNFERCDAENVDEDCRPETFGVTDFDGDGYIDAACCNIDEEDGTMYCGDDCDDEERSTNPNQLELCGDEVDNNCDGEIDIAELFYDGDGDGFGDPSMMMTGACMAGWVTDDSDCSPDDGFIYPGAIDKCDGFHNDCDLVDGGMADPSEDADGDLRSAVDASCVGLGEVGGGGAFPRDDCNDDPANGGADDYLGAMEICGDGRDNDCDGTIDEMMQRVCVDDDGDGHGDPGTLQTITSCDIPDGMVESALCDDCDDGNADRFPGNDDYCDGVDSDCDIEAEDVDGDEHAPVGADCIGAGEPGAGAAPGDVYPRDDCDDSEGTIYPGAVDICDRIDSDCSSGGGLDVAEDVDGDGYASTAATCADGGFPKTDCVDTNDAINPGVGAAADIAACNGVDDDCDPLTNELTSSCSGGGVCIAGGACGRPTGVSQVAPGRVFMCVLRQDGRVICWGSNEYGQLGHPRASVFPVSELPIEVAGLDDVVQLATGERFACARLRAGGVKCWGDNSFGQLGDGSVTLRDTPTDVASLSDAVEITAGERHACALRASGEVVCWGNNGSGQLGDGTTDQRESPTPVPGLVGIAMLAGGANHTCSLDQTGAVDCWGSNQFGQIGDGIAVPTVRTSPVRVPSLAGARMVAAGGRHTCVILADRTVRCWGGNILGQIGNGTLADAPTPTPTSLPGLQVTKIDMGLSHSCALSVGREMYCWGSDYVGELGDGTADYRSVPALVPGLEGVMDIAANMVTSCARLAGGELRCWGNFTRRSGTETVSYESPTTVPNIGAIVDVALGRTHSCALDSDGDTWCWGQSGYVGASATGSVSAPVSVGAPQAVDVSAGLSSTCVLLGTGEVQCWGSNSSGQIGDNTTEYRSSPTPVFGLTNAVSISVGGSHACALLATGGLECWGESSSGQIGDGTVTPDRLVPSSVLDIADGTAVSAGARHTCAIRADSSAVCWGWGRLGQLGNGFSNDRSSPGLPVAASMPIEEVSAGARLSCARFQDSSVWCWGDGGLLGDGANTSSANPVQVLLGTATRGISTGSAHGCAVGVDGGLRCWGTNESGQLGTGNMASATAPVDVALPFEVHRVFAGVSHTCAQSTEGTLWCWGYNSDGQVDGATTVNQLSPMPLWSL